MKIGNATYLSRSDLPETLGLFALEKALVLPGCYLSLNVFEKRYLQLVNDALAGNRVLGIIQTQPAEQTTGQEKQGEETADDDTTAEPPLYKTGCMARIISYTETGDERMIISLQGICRFSTIKETTKKTPYRCFTVEPWLEDLDDEQPLLEEERVVLMETLTDLFETNDLETDWEHVMKTPAHMLVNALAITAPFNTAEKQALLEATTIRERAQTLIALAERSALMQDGFKASDLQ